MPGMDSADPERTETSNGLSPSPNPLPVFFSRAFISTATPSLSPAGSSPSGGIEERETGLGADDETGRHVEPDLGHLAQVGALAAQQLFVLAVAGLE